jgi:hypothetical protein
MNRAFDLEIDAKRGAATLKAAGERPASEKPLYKKTLKGFVPLCVSPNPFV